MAGSRTEKVGTIFTRVTGLLRSGAIQETDKPVWYDVMAAFPPRVEPTYDRVIDSRPTIDIVYKEDIIRAKFYQIFGNPSPIDMTNIHTPTLSQRFVEKYQEVQKDTSESEEKIINIVVEKLKNEGIVLKSLEEIQQEREVARTATLEERRQAELQAMKPAVNVSDMFSFSARDKPDEVYMEEDISGDMSQFEDSPNKSGPT